MRFSIHDVGHGFCASLIADDLNTTLFDCGDTDWPTPWTPAAYLRGVGISEIARFYLSNFDQDHVSGLPGLLNTFRVYSFQRNRSVSADWLEREKEDVGPVTDAMRAALRLHREYVHSGYVPPLPEHVSIRTYHNKPDEFEDTNNLSLVTFLECHGDRIVLPGDLQRAGWLTLLRDERVQEELRSTNVFVASHHGREDGYCREVFDYCTPDVVVISDGPKQYDSQETSHLYANHANGVMFDGSTRAVLSTRADGTLVWSW